MVRDLSLYFQHCNTHIYTLFRIKTCRLTFINRGIPGKIHLIQLLMNCDFFPIILECLGLIEDLFFCSIVFKAVLVR